LVERNNKPNINRRFKKIKYYIWLKCQYGIYQIYDCGSHIVIIEVDEHQHKSYSNCGTTKEEKRLMENKRMFMIFQSFGGPNVVFIRYNPDSFRVKDKVVTLTDKKRHECLLLWVKHFLKNKSKIPLEVKYLFYDEYNERDQSIVTIEEKDVIYHC